MKKLVKTILLLFISVSLLSCSKSEKLFPENREKLTYDSSKSNMTNKVNLDIFSTLVKNNKTDENFVLSPLSIQRCLDLISLCTEDRKDLDFLKMYDDAHLQNLNFKNTSLASLILINLQNVEGKTKNLNYGNIKTVKSSKEGTKTYRDFQKSNLKEILDPTLGEAKTTLREFNRALREFQDALFRLEQDPYDFFFKDTSGSDKKDNR